MENNSSLSNAGEQMELPPGFRFYPTDEELITHYLSQKVLDDCFCARAIGEVDLNKCEPWDLPGRAKMGEKEWYFFCVRDRKYPTGLRTNRATDAGYWKATGKDREIYRAKVLVGMKKTLVFYKGRAPKGEKSDWVMHEYRLEGKYSIYNLPKTARNDWVLCRIFQKTAGGKKVHISGLTRLSSQGNEIRPASSLLPPLMDSSPNNSETRTNTASISHLTCFSNTMEDSESHENMVPDSNTFKYPSSNSSHTNTMSPASVLLPRASFPSSLHSASQISPSTGNFQHQDPLLMPDQSLLRMLLLENHVPNLKKNSNTKLWQDTGLSTDLSSGVTNHNELVQGSFEDQENPSTSAGPTDLDYFLWNYSI